VRPGGERVRALKYVMNFGVPPHAERAYGSLGGDARARSAGPCLSAAVYSRAVVVLMAFFAALAMSGGIANVSLSIWATRAPLISRISR
jgi:hypothetical protein